MDERDESSPLRKGFFRTQQRQSKKKKTVVIWMLSYFGRAVSQQSCSLLFLTIFFILFEK